jgi:adenine C2-methylase RlmN of 23S rRNA A2503 and tRNA A37
MKNFVFISPEFPKTYFNFCDRLKKNGINVTIRREFGGNIDAACGQLRASEVKK